METKKFKVHPDIIFKLIDSQAGSVEKALLELVMNSVDAGATEVKVDITDKGFMVSDNGRGFEDMRAVDEFFGTFGTPHAENDATYGKFRLGRGQIMAFATNNWRSGEFFMGVDVKNRGTEYDQKNGLPLQQGCEIKGDFYERLSRSQALVAERNLAEMVQYVAVPVLVNGKCCSQKQMEMKWTFEDDDAYYQLSGAKNHLAVYNLGVFVSNVWAGNCGIGGVVVSKRQLTLNMARNDVLQSKCAVWKRVIKAIEKHAGVVQKRAPVKNESYRELMASKMLSGDFDSPQDFVNAISSEKIFTDVEGKNHSLLDLHGFVCRDALRLCFSNGASDMVADKVHQQKLAFVLSSKTASRFHEFDFRTLLRKIKQGYRQAGKVGGRDAAYYSYYATVLDKLFEAGTDLGDVRGDINGDYFPCDDKELSKDELAVLSAIRKASCKIHWSVTLQQNESFEGRVGICRDILAGVSEVAEGWTNGVNSIWVNRKLLKVDGTRGGALRHFTGVAMLLVHEYCHVADNALSNVHGPEFYEAYHKLTIDSDCVAGFVAIAMREWTKYLLSSKTRLRKSDLESIDLVETLGDSESPDLKRVAA
jgi:hypothetical protein